jgi:hypothetical protein
MKFDKDVMIDIAYGDCPDGYEKMEDKIVETTRWSILHSMVFKFEGKFYQSSYWVGATEQQDESAYEHDGDGEGMIRCTEVVPEQILVTVYKPAK